MKNNTRKDVHESFHKETLVQKKIIERTNFTYRPIISYIEKYLGRDKRILDIGCGSGTLSFYFAKKGNYVHGIDISEKAIQQCQKSARYLGLSKNTTYQSIDFPHDVPKGKYDVVLLTEVLEHLPNDNYVIKKLYSLLKKDGLLLITTPSLDAPLYKLGLATEFDKRVGHLRRYSVEGLEKILDRNGFSIIEVKKTEGILRNFLYVNPVAGKSVRFIKFFLSDIVTFLDFISQKIFGHSNIYVVAKKSS